MAVLARVLTGETFLYTEPTNAFNARVVENLQRGFFLHGSPTIGYDANLGSIWAGQGVQGEMAGSYAGFTRSADLPTFGTSNTNADYRLLIGKDDSALCAEIERLLNDGWDSYGNPSLVYHPELKHMLLGHAVVRGYTPGGH